jgi:hypothetical protein
VAKRKALISLGPDIRKLDKSIKWLRTMKTSRAMNLLQKAEQRRMMLAAVKDGLELLVRDAKRQAKGRRGYLRGTRGNAYAEWLYEFQYVTDTCKKVGIVLPHRVPMSDWIIK